MEGSEPAGKMQILRLSLVLFAALAISSLACALAAEEGESKGATGGLRSEEDVAKLRDEAIAKLEKPLEKMKVKVGGSLPPSHRPARTHASSKPEGAGYTFPDFRCLASCPPTPSVHCKSPKPLPSHRYCGRAPGIDSFSRRLPSQLIQIPIHPLHALFAPRIHSSARMGVSNQRNPRVDHVLPHSQQNNPRDTQELKQLLTDRGVVCTACSEKDQLVKTVRERCPPPPIWPPGCA